MDSSRYDRVYGTKFHPKVGDLIEFWSDRQTEKGPSSGRVIVVMAAHCIIRHSDHPGETFPLDAIEVEYFRLHEDGGRFWMLK